MAELSPAARRRFVLENTRLTAPPLVPEIRLHLASRVLPIWRMTEAELEATGLPPPYWAFAWAGGQALARHVLDHPELVAGRHVADFGAGSGLVAIAALRAGAASARAVEIDAYAAAAMALNAAANGVALPPPAAAMADLAPAPGLILAGDVFYEQPLAELALAAFAGPQAAGAEVLVGDPGRAYLPARGLERLAEYRVEKTGELEDSDVRLTRVWRLQP